MPALSESKLYDKYNDMLDETLGPVHLGNLRYNASQVLKSVDPVAYNCGYSDWLDAEVSNHQLFEYNDKYYDSKRALREAMRDEDDDTEDDEELEDL